MLDFRFTESLKQHIFSIYYFNSLLNELKLGYENLIQDIKSKTNKINDDLIYLKGKAYELQGQWEQASVYFKQIINTYPTELLADDALFHLAKIQRVYFKDDSAAMESYLKIIDQYPGSIYSEEARLSIRRLRGDKIPE